jgi:nicotinate-nucleotide adenylyltransferase
MAKSVERLGVFGGTFDPVHVGHVVVAAEVRSQLALDRVLLVVAGDPWQKRGKVVASAAQRLMLVEAAVDGVANMATWRRLEETRHLATVVVVERRGDAHAEPPGPGWRVERVSIPRLDVASTDLRHRLGHGRPIDGLVPPEVVHAIRSHGLYTDPG